MAEKIVVEELKVSVDEGADPYLDELPVGPLDDEGQVRLLSLIRSSEDFHDGIGGYDSFSIGRDKATGAFVLTASFIDEWSTEGSSTEARRQARGVWRLELIEGEVGLEEDGHEEPA